MAQDIPLPVFHCEGVADDFARNAAPAELQALGLTGIDQVERFKLMIAEYPLPFAPSIAD